MGQRGPRPKPAPLKALAGNPGKRSTKTNSVDPGVLTDIKPPSFLPRVAKQEWKRVVMKLTQLNLISDLDVMALAAYCNAYATWLTAIKKIEKDKDGILVTSPNGYPMPSPYVKIQRDAQAEMMNWLREFGMTPAARTRFSSDGGGDDDEDPFVALLKRAAQNRSSAGLKQGKDDAA